MAASLHNTMHQHVEQDLGANFDCRLLRNLQAEDKAGMEADAQEIARLSWQCKVQCCRQGSACMMLCS